VTLHLIQIRLHCFVDNFSLRLSSRWSTRTVPACHTIMSLSSVIVTRDCIRSTGTDGEGCVRYELIESSALPETESVPRRRNGDVHMSAVGLLVSKADDKSSCSSNVFNPFTTDAAKTLHFAILV